MSAEKVNSQLQKMAERFGMEPDTMRKRLIEGLDERSSTDVRDRTYCPECGGVGPRTRTEQEKVQRGKYRCKKCDARFDTPATTEEADRIRASKNQRSLLNSGGADR